MAQDLSPFNFSERGDNLTDDLVGLVRKQWNPLCRVIGGHGIAAVAVVPGSVGNFDELKTFFRDLRKDINARFVGFAAYKSSYSFVVLLCPHRLFVECPGAASKLKDRTGLHMNIIQGVILIDSATREVAGDYTRPSRHKCEYEALLAATTRGVEM